jgi:CRP-like cAMP-binding protein
MKKIGRSDWRGGPAIDQLIYAPGATICDGAEAAAALLTIRSGLVKLTQLLPDGAQRIVQLLGKSDILGLEAMLVDTYQHTARRSRRPRPSPGPR